MKRFLIIAAVCSLASPNYAAELVIEGCKPCVKFETAGAAGTATTPTANTDAPPLSADQQPTPWPAVALGLSALNPKPHEVPFDLGCGPDARWSTQVVSFYGSKKAIAIEIDPDAAESARRHVAEAGLSDRIEIITGDATTANVEADIGFVYQFPDVLEKLKPQLQKIKRAFVSYAHAVPGGVPGFSMRRTGDIFIYERRDPVVVQQSSPVVWEQPQTTVLNYRPANYRPATAVWGGRTYSGPLCGRAGCSMCQAIRRQLGWR